MGLYREIKMLLLRLGHEPLFFVKYANILRFVLF